MAEGRKKLKNVLEGSRSKFMILFSYISYVYIPTIYDILYHDEHFPLFILLLFTPSLASA